MRKMFYSNGNWSGKCLVENTWTSYSFVEDVHHPEQQIHWSRIK